MEKGGKGRGKKEESEGSFLRAANRKIQDMSPTLFEMS